MVSSTILELGADRSDERRKRAFEYQIESFLNQWKPDDRQEASQFEAQLISLVRQVYADAQAPILDQMSKLIQELPTSPYLPPR